MRYRLKKTGDDALLAYLRARQKSVSWLARETGMSRMGVDHIVKGDTRRSNTESLELIAEALDMQIDHDERGIYFYHPNALQTAEPPSSYQVDPIFLQIRSLKSPHRALLERLLALIESETDRDVLDIIAEILRLYENRKL